jgi:hypothetical protein
MVAPVKPIKPMDIEFNSEKEKEILFFGFKENQNHKQILMF